MLGTAKKTEEKYRVNIHQHFKSFAADNEQLKPLLQNWSKSRALEVLFKALLTPKTSQHVVNTAGPLLKVLLCRALEIDVNPVHLTYALGQCAHIPSTLSITIECFAKYQTSPSQLSVTELGLFLEGVYRILEAHPMVVQHVKLDELLEIVTFPTPSIKWYLKHIAAKVWKLSPDVLKKSLNEDQAGAQEVYNQLEVLHGNYKLSRHSVVTSQPSLATKDDVMIAGPQYYLGQADLSDRVVCTGANELHYVANKVAVRAMIYTESMAGHISSLGQAVSSHTPVLVQGQIGTGKTLLLNHVASLLGKGSGELVQIQLDESTDSKVLLGGFVCTDVPGQYTWRAGLLTQAVQQGHWLLLEDIDHAPLDLVALLKSVIETQHLSLPDQTIPCHPALQIFVTQRLTEAGHSYKPYSPFTMAEPLFTSLNLAPYTDSELQEIIAGKFSSLKGCAERLVSLFRSLSGSTIRQLMRWCERIASHLTHELKVVTKDVFLEAVDCFCSSLSKPSERVLVAYKIGTFLSLPESKVEYFLTKYRPTLTLSTTHYTVGRSLLACKGPAVKGALFAHTRSGVLLLERVATCIANSEPVLLTGETGNGKTAAVQHLAQQTGNTLTVLNMSQQSDATDLLGGFKPLDVQQVVKPLYEEFELLFKETFSVSKNATFLNKVQLCWRNKEWGTLVKAIIHISSVSAKHKPWAALLTTARKISVQVQQIETSFAFAFVEGSLVNALKKGWWVLLDEINLAPPELLESLNGLVEGTEGSVTLLEAGTAEAVKRHPNFRLFACMNPSTDVGKRDLPAGIKNRFTEIYVDELTDVSDLRTIAAGYLHQLNLPPALLTNVVDLYMQLRELAVTLLVDGRGHKPCYSLRTFCRALSFTAQNRSGNVLRSLYEGFCLSFLTQLSRKSYPLVRGAIVQKLLPVKGAADIIKRPLPKPADKYVCVSGYWLAQGDLDPHTDQQYIMTETVEENLKDLARAVSSGQYPVLLQGPTSAGKTSVVKYLAALTGTTVVRVNNHEHTDLQEYVGSYCVNELDKLAFKEGILAEAMRDGHWLILDELNLAPCEVLEALNRVLDDNRELFIAETQTTIKAHPHFMLFATQNPAGSYGGRKLLSRAFRNRFIELHYEDLPLTELTVILEKRCNLPTTYCKKMVNVMKELQAVRGKSGIFSGRHSLITLRDLFRWANRYDGTTSATLLDWDQQLVDDGYMLLSGRVRQVEETEIIQGIIEKIFKRKVDEGKLFEGDLFNETFGTTLQGFSHVVFTSSMKRLLSLVVRALKFSEPVLLVGETGCGKTTVCQMLALLNHLKLHMLNCHMHSDTADFIGSLRPVRDGKGERLFEWVDGPLINAIKDGDMVLLDEISLADDSVLERLNSVLESEREITVAESNDAVTYKAHANFRIIATMNPGGDFGKKELSPALRNRFTEIWCTKGDDRRELAEIAQHNLNTQSNGEVAQMMVEFIEWFKCNDVSKKHVITVRDVLMWITYINQGHANTTQAYLHGAALVIIDGLGEECHVLRHKCYLYVEAQCKERIQYNYTLGVDEKAFYVGNMRIERGSKGKPAGEAYSFNAPTTATNALRLMRGMQVGKPVLLEGHPGVGKTSLISAVAAMSGHSLTRINLSEQSDLSDLFGCDLPSEKGAYFVWRDGPLLQALKSGSWVLLDEMNLASQSVLEGLNACLDHRGEIFIPELSKSFSVSSSGTSRFFACMNPVSQGGGRKALPKSFMNRFVKVYVDTLTKDDIGVICSATHSEIESGTLRAMIDFNHAVYKQVCVDRSWGQSGSPWEFNLRDITRWCGLLKQYPALSVPEFISTIYAMRFRTHADRDKIAALTEAHFGHLPTPSSHVKLITSPDRVQIGESVVARCPHTNISAPFRLVDYQLGALRVLAQCVNMKWMSILVGPKGCGKSTLVRQFSELCGRTLVEVSCNPALDTLDLLGGYSQVNTDTYINDLKRVSFKLSAELFANGVNDGSTSACRELSGRISSSLSVKDIVTAARLLLKSLPEASVYHGEVREIVEKLEVASDGQFEWRDSAFVSALEKGSWVLLDNANLVSPSVLDRLNPLLESQGVLTLDERGSVGGEVVVIQPHPDFRLFMTMDPNRGELSRPMRNRGVEVHLQTESGVEEMETEVSLPVEPVCISARSSSHCQINLVSSAVSSVLDQEDTSHLTEAVRVTYSYLPPCVWALFTALVQSRVKDKGVMKCCAGFVQALKEMPLDASGDAADLNHNASHHSAKRMEASVKQLTSVIVHSLLEHSTPTHGQVIQDLVMQVMKQEWGNEYEFREHAHFISRLKEETAVSIHASCWWVLRGHVNSSPVTKALDQRFGTQCDDSHWNFIKQFGHPALTSDTDAPNHQVALEEPKLLQSSDPSILSVLFPAVSYTPVPSASLPVIAELNKPLLLDLLVLLTSPALLAEQRSAILSSIQCDLPLYLNYTLANSDPDCLSDVCAGLLSFQQDGNPLTSDWYKTQPYKILQDALTPTLSTYTAWSETVADVGLSCFVAALLLGNPMVRCPSQTLAYTMEQGNRVQGLDISSDNKCLSYGLALLSKSTSLSSVDPVQYHTVLLNCTIDFLAELETLHSLHSTIQDSTQGLRNGSHGNSSDCNRYPLNLIAGFMKEQRVKGEELRAKCGYRPTAQHNYDALREEMQRFKNTLGNLGTIKQVMCDKGKSNAWTRSTTQFVCDLYQNYWFFRDILSPFVVSLTLIIWGLRDEQSAVKQSAFLPAPAESLIANVMRLIDRQELSTNSDKYTFLALLENLSTYFIYQQTLDKTSPDLRLKDYILEKFDVIWTNNETLKRSLEEAKDSVYKDKEIFTKDEAEMDETKLRELFPLHNDFEDVDSFDQEGLDPQKATAESETDTVLQMDNYLKNMVQLFTEAHSETPSAVFKRMFGAMYGLVKPVHFAENNILASHMVQCHLLLKERVEESVELDLYHGTHPAEIMRLKPLTEQVREKVNGFLATWPEHPALTQMCLVLDRIDSFSIEEPVMKFLQGLEILLQKGQLWESVASKEVSMALELALVSKQIIRWREAELRSWPKLLSTLKAQYEGKASKWYLNLHMLVSKQTDEESVMELLVTIFSYIESSTVGDFSVRLEYLKSCAEGDNPNASLIKAVSLYYHQLLPLVQKHLEDQSASIKKELTEYIKIVRWKDVNYFSLKQTTDTSHHKLLKFVKKFEAILSTPALPLLHVAPVELTQQADVKMSSALDSSVTMVSHLRHEIVGALKMFQELNVDGIEDKDKRLKMLKNIDLRKRKSISELFKCLNYCGLSYKRGIVNHFSHDYYLELFKSLAPCPALAWTQNQLYHLIRAAGEPCQDLGPTELERIKGISGELISTITEVASVRQRLSAQLEQIAQLANALHMRGEPGGWAPQEVKTAPDQSKSTVQRCLKQISLLTDCQLQLALIKEALSSLSVSDSQFKQLLNTEDVLSEVFDLIEQLRRLWLTLNEREQGLRAVLASGYLITIQDRDTIVSIEEDITSSLALLTRLKESQYTLSCDLQCDNLLFAGVESFIVAIAGVQDSAALADSAPVTTVAKLHKVLRELECNRRGPLLLPAAEVNKNWDVSKDIVMAVSTQLVTHIADMRVQHSLDTLKEAVSQIPRLQKRSSAPIIRNIQSFVIMLHSDTQMMAENVSHWLDEALLPFSKLLFNLFLDLLKKGYCKPAELQEAEEAGETFEAGEDAGMGEGQGSNDVSDQIEDESQVEGTQNEKKEEQESVKEEKEGLDMNEDFEGALEDVEKEEGEEGEEDEDDDGEKEENDEQMGDVDEAEEQDKKQTFGDDDDELPDDEQPENSEGAQSKEQPELAAKEEDLEKEKGQQLPEEGEEEEDPNEEAGEAGQMQDDMMDKEPEDLPEDLDLGDMDEEDGGPEDAGDMDDGESDGEEEEETAEPMEEDVEDNQQEDNAEEESASAALPDQQETPAEGSNDAAQSIAQPSTSDDQTAEREEEGKEMGAEKSKGGDSTALPSALEEAPKPELKRQQPDEEPRQQAESSKAKRLKTVPRKESKQAELKEVDVFEHTEEGEDADAETMDTAKDKESRADLEMIEDEKEEEESENILEADEKEEDKAVQAKLSKQSEVQDVRLEELRLEEEGKEEEKEESDAMKDDSASYYNIPDLVTQKQQITELRRKAMDKRKNSTSTMSAEEAKFTWGSFEAITAPLAQELCEQLRLILTPTKAAKLKGDYRSGKRLNMKKVIPYIASQFQKDKIWLRRTKPSAREYQVMVALDDSASMGESQSIQMSLEAVAALCSAMTKLDVGQVGVCGFGDEPSLILPFNEPFTSTAGARVVQHFTFQQQNTDIVKLLDSTTQHFADSSAQSRAGPLSQLLFIISDGRGLFLKGVDAVKRSVKEAWDAGIFIVFLIVDQHDSKESIMNIRTPVFDKGGKLLRIEPYLDTFPFPYYVVLRKAEELPHTLTDALRQWVEIVSGTD